MTVISLHKKKHLFDHGPREDDPEACEGERVSKVEVTHVRRVLKRGEKAVRHRSELLENDGMSDKNLEITREVIQMVSDDSSEVAAKTPAQERESFACLRCGAVIPADSVRCPVCSVLYIDDPTGCAIDEDPERTNEVSLEADVPFEKSLMAFIHLDASTGLVTCLRSDEEDSDNGLECQNCGAVTLFSAPRCPICGHSFAEEDTGLVGLLEGLKFDLDGDTELDCPSCGDHVVTDGQRCPSCKEIINPQGAFNQAAGVLTLLKGKNVVFVHLDVETGDMVFAQKMKSKVSIEEQRIHLDSVGSSGFDRDWKSLARL